MESKKYTKLVNKTTKNQTYRYREQASGYPWGDSPWNLHGQDKSIPHGFPMGKIRVGDEEVQTIRYKISYKDILHNMGNIANIL